MSHLTLFRLDIVEAGLSMMIIGTQSDYNSRSERHVRMCSVA